MSLFMLIVVSFVRSSWYSRAKGKPVGERQRQRETHTQHALIDDTLLDLLGMKSLDLLFLALSLFVATDERRLATSRILPCFALPLHEGPLGKWKGGTLLKVATGTKKKTKTSSSHGTDIYTYHKVVHKMVLLCVTRRNRIELFPSKASPAHTSPLSSGRAVGLPKFASGSDARLGSNAQMSPLQLERRQLLCKWVPLCAGDGASCVLDVAVEE